MAGKGRRRSGAGTLYKRGGKGAWIASWFDHNGKRKEKSTRTTDRATAERIIGKLVADTALRREGVIDAAQDRFAIEGRKPLSEHIKAYLGHCRHVGHAAKSIDNKDRHLNKIDGSIADARLSDLTADSLEGYLSTLKESGRSARTVNLARQIAVAFYSWCVKTGRAERNPLKVVPKLDESRDRRRVRRPLTDEELVSLLHVAREQGREAWYLTAAFAGLRRGDLQRLTWADVDFEAGTLTIKGGKAKRIDTIPLHPQLAEALKRRFDAHPAIGPARVFPETVTDRTRLRDFLRAGIARKEIVRDANGKPVLLIKGEGENAVKVPKIRIVAEDEDGRVIDLHALRTTLGTQLARAGVAPQIAQKIMRHSDYGTTLKHYTVLGLTDTARAIEALPRIGTSDNSHSRATGTDGAPANNETNPQQYPQQLARQTVLSGANGRDAQLDDGSGGESRKPLAGARLSDAVRPSTKMERKGLEPSTSSLQSGGSSRQDHRQLIVHQQFTRFAIRCKPAHSSSILNGQSRYLSRDPVETGTAQTVMMAGEHPCVRSLLECR